MGILNMWPCQRMWTQSNFLLGGWMVDIAPSILLSAHNSWRGLIYTILHQTRFFGPLDRCPSHPFVWLLSLPKYSAGLSSGTSSDIPPCSMQVHWWIVVWGNLSCFRVIAVLFPFDIFNNINPKYRELRLAVSVFSSFKLLWKYSARVPHRIFSSILI